MNETNWLLIILGSGLLVFGISNLYVYWKSQHYKVEADFIRYINKSLPSPEQVKTAKKYFVNNNK